MLGLLLLLLLLLLFLPLDLSLRFVSTLAAPDWEEELTGSARWLVRLRWGGAVLAGEWEGENLRLTQWEVRILGFRPRTRSRPEAAKARARKQKKRRKRGGGFDLELLVAVLQECARFLGRMITATSFRFRGEITYGFADPALTGWAEAIRGMAGIPVPIRLEADFQRPCLTGWADADGRLYGYQVAGAVLRSLRNPVIRDRLVGQIRSRPLRYLLMRVVLRGG